jgi:hypothetical protein
VKFAGGAPVVPAAADGPVPVMLAVPFIPGLRDVPRLIPVHRLIWRRWGDPPADGTPPPADTSGPVGTATVGKT